MYIEIDPSFGDPLPRLLDAENFRGLKLVIGHDALQDNVIPEVALRIGTWVDDSHVFIQPDDIISLAAGRAAAPEWIRQFDAMIAYAVASGWMNEEGAVRLHVEYRKLGLTKETGTPGHYEEPSGSPVAEHRRC